MAQIPDGGRHLPRGQGRKFRLAKPHRTGIGCFTQEHPAQRRFAAGHRAGDADDIAGVGGEVQAGEDGHIAIGKGEIFQGDVSGLRHLQGLQLLRLLHQRLDALPGDFGLLYGVEQLCHLGGFDHQLGKAGQEGGECGNVPAAPPGAQHIFCAEPQDEQHAGFGRCQIQRRQSRLPHIAAHGGLFVPVQRVLILFGAGVLTAVNAVGHGVPGTVQRGSAQGTSRLFVGRTGALHRLFHPCRAHIGKRREQQTEQGQPPVVHQQHDHIACQRHTGIKDLSGELAHALHAVVHIRDGLGHQLTGTLLLQCSPALPHQIGIQDAFHPAVDVVGKAPHIEPLDEPCRLHHQDGQDIGQHQQGHAGGGLAAAQNVGQALGQTALEPRRCQQADVVNKTRDRHEGQRQPLDPEIGKHPVRAEGLSRSFHGQFHLLRCSGSAGIPHGSRLWTRCTACSAQPQKRRLPPA